MKRKAEAFWTPDEFRSWRERCGYTWRTAARALAISDRMIPRFDSDETPVTKVVALVCMMVERNPRLANKRRPVSSGRSSVSSSAL